MSTKKTHSHVQGLSALSTLFILPTLLPVMACSTLGDSDEQSVFREGVSIASDILGDTDVTGMRYVMTPVDCLSGTETGEDPIVVDRFLEDILLPAGIGNLENNPLDEDSAHLFADAFVALPPGCYNILITPTNSEGDPSEDCAAAWENNVEVFQSTTTEIIMINQCAGEDNGAIDAIAILNHEPEFKDLEFETSKFVTCDEAQVICATVEDVDLDPIEFEWIPSPENPTEFEVIIELVDPDPETGLATSCIEVVPEFAGTYEFVVEAYDMAWKGDELIRIEKWLEEAGYPNESHAELAFPFYVGDCTENACVEGLDLVLLEDLSGSFIDDLSNLNTLVGPLFDALVAESADSRIGIGSYIDKPFAPFGSPTDYVYEFELALTGDKDLLVATQAGLTAGSGSDFAEAQLEAIFQLALNADDYGFSSDNRFVVLMTDAPFHQAGDCFPLLCTEENNGDSTADELEDYPSIIQAAEALVDAGITPIFAVTVGELATYESLSVELGIPDARIVELAFDSSNLLEAVLDGVGCLADEE